MGWKENLSQASKELMDGKIKTDEPMAAPVSVSAPVAAAPQVMEPEVEEKETFDIVEEAAAVSPAISGMRRKTIIADGTVITGNIQTENDMEFYGELRGSIASEGDLFLRGKITGNVSGKLIDLRGINMAGDISAEGQVVVDENSSVEGNVQGQSLTLNGAVRGDITLTGVLRMQSHASVVGNIKAARLSVEEGATMQGELAITGE